MIDLRRLIINITSYHVSKKCLLFLESFESITSFIEIVELWLKLYNSKKIIEYLTKLYNFQQNNRNFNNSMTFQNN